MMRSTQYLSCLAASFILVVLALSACGVAEESPTPTSVASNPAEASATPAPTATSIPTATPTPLPIDTPTPSASPTPTPTPTPTHPLMIEVMREREYPGSDLVVEETLSPGSNYDRYVVSYQSEGLTIYALLTVPYGEPPETGWPVIIFNHGYIPPEQHRTTQGYIALRRRLRPQQLHRPEARLSGTRALRG